MFGLVDRAVNGLINAMIDPVFGLALTAETMKSYRWVKPELVTQVEMDG